MSTAHQPPAAPAGTAPPPSGAAENCAPVPSRVYRLSIEQYNAMVEAGCFETGGHARPKLELLEGVLTNMRPTKPPHAVIVDELNYWAVDSFDRQAYRVSIQSPIEIHPSSSEPEPDVVIFRAFSRATRHPAEGDIALVIEVADSSLANDLGQKARIYARGGVPEYWVVDIPGRKLHVHRRPEGDAYTAVSVVEGDASAAAEIVGGTPLHAARLFAVLDA
ncbi:MAG: Uma2 family endonuclease [Planctomycetota bacterium]